jgi:hypothetical protein
MRLSDLGVLAAAILWLAASQAQAQVHGADVQVNEGAAVPTVDQLRIVLNPNDLVRDILGWHKADAHCNLRTNPTRRIAIPKKMRQLYANVESAQGKNFVTLAFNNKRCGQISNSGVVAFPDTDELRA